MNLRLATMSAAVALMFFTPIASYAQDIPPAPLGTVAPSAVDTKSDTYTQQKLDQMLAPIALYPDQLVSQILMASTFPLQIVQAARWLDNPGDAALKGEALVNALQPMNWDPSVKSITAFAAIVTMLNKNLDWTDSLGVAFTHQQSDVMAQIQFLRHQAQNAGNLASNDKIVCRDDGPNVVIAPVEPNVVYAPYYNPAVVYGTWWYPYPPYSVYPPAYVYPPGLAFATGILVGAAIWGNANWHRGEVNVNVNHYNQFNRTTINNSNWNHSVEHRKGVAYKDQNVANRYNRGTGNQAARSREAYRGRDVSTASNLAGAGSMQAGRGAGPAGASARDAGSRPSASSHDVGRSGGGGGFQGMNNASATRAASARGGASAGGARAGGGGRRR